MGSSAAARLALSSCLVSSFACGGEPPALEAASASRAAPIVGGVLYAGVPAVGALTVAGAMWCTGTVIAPRQVLTAAHCVRGVSPSTMRFVLGPRVKTPEHVLEVEELVAHPDYDPEHLTNDIAYVVLAEDAPVDPLPRVDDPAWTGAWLLHVGYGANNGRKHTGAGRKRAVWMRVSAVDAGTFSYGSASANTCFGDSGGPALFELGLDEYAVAGVTSFGDGSCTAFGVDTRVDVHRDFLDAAGDDAEPDPCAGETYEGRCDGDVIVWCEGDEIKEWPCEGGTTCGWSEAVGYYDCVW